MFSMTGTLSVKADTDGPMPAVDVGTHVSALTPECRRQATADSLQFAIISTDTESTRLVGSRRRDMATVLRIVSRLEMTAHAADHESV